MDKQRLIMHMKSIDLPSGQYAIFGGGCLAIRGIRDFADIDLFVTPLLYKELLSQGWRETSSLGRPPYLIANIDDIEHQAFSVWEGGEWQPKIANYIKNPEVVENLPFMPLQELYDWKVATRRDKDLNDVALIDSYWHDKKR